MLVLLMKLSLPERSFTKFSFGLEGRLCNKASINLFIHDQAFLSKKHGEAEQGRVCRAGITFEVKIVRGFPVLMGERIARHLLLACCSSLESLSCVEVVCFLFFFFVNSSNPMRLLSVKYPKSVK